MDTIKYKGHDIEFRVMDGKFTTVINGVFKKFSSLQSAKNAIDKTAVVDFKPIDVLLIKETGYRPSISEVKAVKLISYREEKGYRSNFLQRFFITDKGDKVYIDTRRGGIFPVKYLVALEKSIKEENELEQIVAKSQKRIEKLKDEREKIVINDQIDPRPDAND
jgi:hypothetical protein